ncbi:zinc/manganese transport system substrate-binding protein [Arboricoccus pini]|uniref:Zinc/manganese transport system substrate-binding protein n=1 Tax=Arboricoccus pini TaxID=1963835 RepID=A0A212RVS2_9PROT|nr:metal ABC transporter substrate-binding protein [Arboricoccus pini]SNB76817.1 zinc/manganese transport system substrate-binding protein [Arboricoccus pini]
MVHFLNRHGLAGVCLAGAVFAAPMAEAREFKVVTSFTILGDMVQQIGGPHVEVTTLVGPNGDPHVYEPTPQDAEKLASADIVFVSGLGMEGWMDRLIKASGYKGKPVTLSTGIKTRQMDEEEEGGHDHGHGERELVTDPHAWNNPLNGIIYVQNIAKALTAADPEDAADINARAKDYEASLRQLDAWAAEAIAAVPKDRRKVITSHDAFGYMADRYGITFLSPEGFSTESEASAADVAALVDLMKRNHIKVVFMENSNDPRLVQQIAREAGGRLGGSLYPESLTGPEGPAPTYERLIRYNIETLKAGMLAP